VIDAELGPGGASCFAIDSLRMVDMGPHIVQLTLSYSGHPILTALHREHLTAPATRFKIVRNKFQEKERAPALLIRMNDNHAIFYTTPHIYFVCMIFYILSLLKKKLSTPEATINFVRHTTNQPPTHTNFCTPHPLIYKF